LRPTKLSAIHLAGAFPGASQSPGKTDLKKLERVLLLLDEDDEEW
jgi:hypothetical protein